MNNIHNTIDKININSIRAMLAKYRWVETKALCNGSVLQFISPDGNHAAHFPLNKNLSDYYDVVEHSLKTIALCLNTSIESLLTRLLNPMYDILKWRMVDYDGKVPFFSMINELGKIKNILAVSSLDILNPAKFHTKIYTKAVNDNIMGYSIGQSEHGSYILNVLCPLDRYELDMFQDANQNELPLRRKVNMRLLKSVSQIQKDLEDGNINKVDEDVDRGEYSINFLDAIGNIFDEDTGTKVNIIMDWCKAIQLPSSFDYSNVLFDVSYKDVINSIADKYRPKKTENLIQTYYGKIETISAKPELSDREHVTIKIATIGKDNKKISVNAKLNYEQYYSQIELAFKNSKNIMLSGTLQEISGRKWIDGGTFEVLL